MEEVDTSRSLFCSGFLVTYLCYRCSVYSVMPRNIPCCLLVVQKGLLCTKKAQFRYYEYQKVRNNGFMTRRRVDGTFMEDIEMDVDTGAFERISVPPILESRRSTVLHDFETVILNAVCSQNCTCTVS